MPARGKKTEPVSTRYREKLAAKLFEDGERRTQLLESLERGESAQPSIIWCGSSPVPSPFVAQTRRHWQPSFVDTVQESDSAGSHPLHASGAYYCADLSSVFCASVLLGISEDVSRARVLDLCASPGGKSVFASRALTPELLVANETIKKRLGALIGNVKRCGLSPVTVTASDSSRFAEHATEAFDVAVVDAPCSGQSLPAKSVEAKDAFHPLVIGRNSNRQKRIIANAGKAVRPGGYLAYMTCTYSSEENERVVEWFVKKFPNWEAVAISRLDEFRTEYSALPAYRLWPWQKHGAGGFAALLRNGGTGRRRELSLNELGIRWSSAVISSSV